MDIQVGRYLAINVSQKTNKFDASVATLELTNHFARGNIQGRK